MKNVAVVGATGSIGQSALDVIRRHPGELRVCALVAGANAAGLARAAREFRPAFTALADPALAGEFRQGAGDAAGEFFAGADGVDECLRRCRADVCLSAAGGLAGLRPTLTAIDCGMEIALANKETLVAAGDVIMALVQEKKIALRPVDSEHSAIAQCLRAGALHEVSRLLVTGSGGPFREWPKQKLAAATPADALRHPTWSMGRKITIDSATLANKALEVIEAHHLFSMPYERIAVLIHPQSIVHGAVEFADGALVAQMGAPDMRLPILYALTGGARRETGAERLTLERLSSLTFAAPDLGRFPMLALGLEAARRGGLAPAIYSAANEAAVELFLAGKLSFPGIAAQVEAAMARVPALPVTLANVLAADAEARARVRA